MIECWNSVLQNHVGGRKGPSLIHLVDASDALECLREAQMVADRQEAASHIRE